MSDTGSTGDRPVSQTRTTRRQLKEARRELATLERRLDNRREDVEVLRAQLDVLGMEALPPAVRQARDATTPEGLETDRGVASFVVASRMHRRHNTTGVHRRNGLREPILDLYTKTAGRRFAELHGVQVPAILGTWKTPDDIEWDELPRRFVVKSSRGGGGINVFPLERREDRFFDFIAQKEVTAEAVTKRLWKKHQDEAVYIAEEFLVGLDGERMPDDIKVFCFYGEPAFIEVRTEDWSRKRDGRQRLRTFLPDGTELFHVRALIPHGDDIGTPVDFAGVVQAAATLSAAIRRPIQRLDFYETDHGIVFGEVTQNPGRPPALVSEWDRRLGETYEDASARLFGDLAAEGHLGLQYGDVGS